MKKKSLHGLIPAFFALSFFLSAPLRAEMAPDTAFGYKTYFLHHPPKDNPIKQNLYPFAGDIIRYGQDIPVCAAARTPAAYTDKTGMRFVLHGKAGWLFRTVDFRTNFTATPQAMEYFNRLNRVLASNGQTLVVAFPPPRALTAAKYIDPADKPAGYLPEKAVLGYRAFIRQLNDSGIIAPDLSAPPDLAYFPKGDFHWNPEGARHAAERIALEVKETSAYRKIEKQDFESGPAGTGTADRGAFEEFIQTTCKMNIELTAEPLWDTYAKKAPAADAETLFGEAAFPDVTVLGTSNSAEDSKFNFVGSLKRFLQADVYNAALEGGGFGASALRYFASDDYRDRPPKVIIWEFLPQHNYNSVESLNAFRQMIPAVYGACDDKKALARYAGDITLPQTHFFPQFRDKSLKGTYLYLEVRNPAEKNLKVEVLYKNGEADRIDLARAAPQSTRSRNSEKYYLELGGPDNNALFFRVVTDVPQGHITARICPYPLQVAEK